MKLLVVALSVASLRIFGQGIGPEAQRIGRACSVVPASEKSSFNAVGCTPEREAQIRQTIRIKTAIALHRSFELPDAALGPGVSLTASDLADDGHALRLTGVEIVSNGVILRADQLVYDWASRRIEARGTVQLIAPQ